MRQTGSSLCRLRSKGKAEVMGEEVAGGKCTDIIRVKGD